MSKGLMQREWERANNRKRLSVFFLFIAPDRKQMEEALKNIRSGLEKRQAALKKTLQYRKRWSEMRIKISKELNEAKLNMKKMMD
ncbi:MAG: hypothetical protein ACEPOZ_19385 [Marinifilaceae bacterium]